MTYEESLMPKHPRKTGRGIAHWLCLVVTVDLRMTVHFMNNGAL